MGQDSNDKLVKNRDNIAEGKDNLPFIKNTLPSRRNQRSIQRQPKKIVKEESKQDVQEQDINVQVKNLENSTTDDSNCKVAVSEKIVSNVKHVTKNSRAGIICVCLAILIAFLVIMIFLIFSKDDKDNSLAKYLDNMRSQDVVLCDSEQVNYFFKSYYDALSAGNTTVLEGLYDDPSKASITTEVSKIVESFNNIKVYVTKGLQDKEIVAFVYNELKFPNIETLAPSVDTYYLRYDESNNSVKIMTNMYTDGSIIKYINVVAKKDPIRTLLTDTNEKLNSALDTDKDLKNLYLIMQSMTDSGYNTTTK